jgi:hypothetical protein
MMMQGPGVPWPASAIQDTVAAIISQPPYQRSIRATLLDRLMDWLAALIRRIFSAVSELPNAKWIVLGVAVLALIAIALRIALGSEAGERRRRARVGVVTGGGDPWVEAERLAAAGDYTEAAHLLYRGVVERLAASDLIRPHPSRTSGDYARDLQRRGSPAAGEFRQLGRRYDRALFGIRSFDAATYAALREHATRVIRLQERAA